MKLRTKKRLLNAASLGLTACAGGILWHTWHLEPPAIDIERTAATSKGSQKPLGTTPQVVVSLDPSRWNRTLRQPLYDPPPPPPQEVVVEHRPITVKLVGTVIEAENSQAFVRQQSGAVEIKRLGDQVTADAADGVIATITAAEIVIRREDGEHHVAVDGSN